MVSFKQCYLPCDKLFQVQWSVLFCFTHNGQLSPWVVISISAPLKYELWPLLIMAKTVAVRQRSQLSNISHLSLVVMQLYRKMCPLYWEAVNCSPIKLFFSNRDISLWRPCHYILLLFPQHWIYNAKKMGNIYSSKWPLCYKMNKEIINGSVSARLHVPLGKINRISPERVKRKKKREREKSPTGSVLRLNLE